MAAKGTSTLCVFFCLLWPFSAAPAHHATAAQYDVSKTITLKGTITQLDWANPHIHVYMTAKTANNHDETWKLEFPSPGAVIVAGLSKELLMPGTLLTFEVYVSKEVKSQRSACVKAVTLADGSHVGFVVGI